MTETLLRVVSRYSEAHASPSGVAQTPIPDLMTVRATEPSELQHAICQPLVCLVLQGSKRVATGEDSLLFSAGDSLLITADVPCVSQIVRASAAAPYLSLVLNLDMAVVTALTLEMGGAQMSEAPAVLQEPTHVEVADCALRLMRLLDRPASLPVLRTQVLRELHYWLLAGRHGPAIRRLGWPDGHRRHIARAVSLLRAEFARPLRVDHLAQVAGMSPSSFHHHFRAVTSLSPLQFQKQLRLIEARRLMLAEGSGSSQAAYAVGYESASQFTREYRRMFGLPPHKEVDAARRKEVARDTGLTIKADSQEPAAM